LDSLKVETTILFKRDILIACTYFWILIQKMNTVEWFSRKEHVVRHSAKAVMQHGLVGHVLYKM